MALCYSGLARQSRLSPSALGSNPSPLFLLPSPAASWRVVLYCLGYLLFLSPPSIVSKQLVSQALYREVLNMESGLK